MNKLITKAVCGNGAALRETNMLLEELGVPKKLAGRRYLLRAVLLLIESRELKLGMSKTLYSNISREQDASALGVARCIRGAIEATWKKGDRRALRECFRSYEELYCPTNTEFIAKLRDIVMLRLMAAGESDDSIA